MYEFEVDSYTQKIHISLISLIIVLCGFYTSVYDQDKSNRE